MLEDVLVFFFFTKKMNPDQDLAKLKGSDAVCDISLDDPCAKSLVYHDKSKPKKGPFSDRRVKLALFVVTVLVTLSAICLSIISLIRIDEAAINSKDEKVIALAHIEILLCVLNMSLTVFFAVSLSVVHKKKYSPTFLLSLSSIPVVILGIVALQLTSIFYTTNIDQIKTYNWYNSILQFNMFGGIFVIFFVYVIQYK